MTLAETPGDVREAPARLPSSWRHRRLVIGGRVLVDPVALARPAMRPRELALVTALMSRARHMLEFGAGGSTTLALKLGVSRIVAVESDASWIERLKADEAAARAITEGRLRLLHADIGATVALGAPADRAARERWPDYASLPWAHVDQDALDLVLIDGRFRVACIMQAVLHVRPQTLIAVHDFWNRPAYHAVLPYLDPVARRERLGVFRPKPAFDRAEAEQLFTRSAYLPS